MIQFTTQVTILNRKKEPENLSNHEVLNNLKTLFPGYTFYEFSFPEAKRTPVFINRNLPNRH